eukprot:m.159359 g.159359  ORF g.159359 m.159359 type:complete len:50 (+) comp16347_c2_seq2:1014-1163(+)
MQRHLVAFILRHDICAAFDQQSGDIEMAITAGPVQRRIVLLLGREERKW